MARLLAAFVFGLTVIALLMALRLADPYPVRVARETSFDFYQQLLPRAAPDDLPIRIVDIDEASLAAVGQWPWPRDVMATLTQRLLDMGAAAVALDLLFSEPDRLSRSGEDKDARLAQTLAAGPTVLALAQSPQAQHPSVVPKAGFAATGAQTQLGLPELNGAAQPLPLLAENASGLGVASLERGGAGVARRLPLLWRSGEAVFPTLALEALRVAMAVPTLVAIGDGLGQGTVEVVRVGELSMITGPSADLWLYYRPLDDAMFIPAAQILGDDPARLAERIAGHIVLVGTSASGLLDIRVSALGEAVPGVTIHAQALEQMLTGVFLDRADWVAGLELLIFALAGVLVVGAVVITGPLAGLLVAAGTMAAVTAGSWWAFSGPRLLIDPSFALVGILALYTVLVVFRFAVSDADRRRIRRAFAHYVEPSLLNQIEADGRLLRLGGDVREMTVMFSDLRNFSALAERTAPSELVAILNRLFGVLGHAIIAHKGTIDKFMGDAVMAFWNAPAPTERHALAACRAALAMRQALDTLNGQGGEPIRIGIGIATGPALVGNMGFEKRFDYSCVGDTVNVASRVEGACRAVGYDLLVSAATAAEAPEMAFLDAGRVELKGMSGREAILLLVGDEAVKHSAAFARLAAAHGRLMVALAEGGANAGALAECEALAASVDGQLPEFYAALALRAQDFAPA